VIGLEQPPSLQDLDREDSPGGMLRSEEDEFLPITATRKMLSVEAPAAGAPGEEEEGERRGGKDEI
jgi:hypothetical protein